MKIRCLLAGSLMLFGLGLLPAWAQAPTLVPATLSGISPSGVSRGQEVELVFQGLNIQDATEVVFDDPAITGTVAPGENKNQVKVTATVGESARPGIHSAFLHTPLGTTGGVSFAVSAWPETKEQEPNDSPEQATSVTLPATLTGAIGATGDVDHYRFAAAEGDELVFEVIATQVRSRLTALLSILDAEGQVLLEQQPAEGRADPVFGFRFPRSGEYVLRVADLENAGGGDVHYRIHAGAFGLAQEVFPLGIRRGSGEVSVSGFNLGTGNKLAVESEATGWGATTTVSELGGVRLLRPVRLAVGADPEVFEEERPNHTPAEAQPVTVPVTINGRISGGNGRGDVDHYRFSARRGEELVLEVNARRLGSPLDSIIEVVDTQGRRIERARLRCVAQTEMTLNDRDSATAAVRIATWTNITFNDFLYLRGEVVRVAALPKGPDEDILFRSFRGQRYGYFDTTPSGHALGTPVYKVQVHPPGTEFAPNGMPVFRLYYQNDDGGPLYGKDSRLTFTAPDDGDYIVRIADVRGEQSPRHAYRLTIREPRPDFRLVPGFGNLNIPPGTAIPVSVTVERYDGFEGEIQVRLEGLPEGVTSTETTIQAGETAATLLVSAEPTAATQDLSLRLVGTAAAPDGDLVRDAKPGGARARLTVLPNSDLTVQAAQQRLEIVPGTRQHVEVSITRENGFGGRVPIDLKNLPFGVWIEDVGLNGVLITESETSRRFTIVCEPWVAPLERTVYCTARTESGSGAPTEVGVPVVLEVRPAAGARTVPETE
jgi:hypothetical protein